MSAAHWSVTEHRGPEGLKAVEADWRHLYAEMPRTALWHSYEAYTVYIDHLCPSPERFMCLALSDGTRTRAILPLEERAEPGLGVPIRIWGMPWNGAWRPTDAIGPEDDARGALLPAVVDYLRRLPGRPGILVLGQTWDGSVLWEGLSALSASRWFAFADGAEFVMSTDRTFDELQAALSHKSRSNIHKLQREFEALPGAEYRRVTADDELAEEYEQFLEVEASGWKGERGSAIRQHPELVAFYRGLIERLRLDGRCEVHALYAEDRCIASGLCIYTRREAAGLKSGYDERYASVAPGVVLVHKELEWSCQDPDVDVMSQVSDAPWLRRWHPDSNGVRRAYVSLRPAWGGLLLTLLRFRYGPMRRWARSFKAWRASQDDRARTHRGRDAG